MNRIATPDAIARPTFAVDAAANVLRRPCRTRRVQLANGDLD
jgi:hypothetical protein